MPYKTDPVPIKDPFLDRRVKLLPCQKEMVQYWYLTGLSITKIARMFHVNKRLIQFELFPERKEKNLLHREQRGGTMIYYKGGKEWAEIMQTHRKYKYKILKEII